MKKTGDQAFLSTREHPVVKHRRVSIHMYVCWHQYKQMTHTQIHAMCAHDAQPIKHVYKSRDAATLPFCCRVLANLGPVKQSGLQGDPMGPVVSLLPCSLATGHVCSPRHLPQLTPLLSPPQMSRVRCACIFKCAVSLQGVFTPGAAIWGTLLPAYVVACICLLCKPS